MSTWQVERRKRTRHLIELGGLVVKAGFVELTGDDRATVLGALLWMADKLRSDQGQQARELWTEKGKQAFQAERKGDATVTCTSIGKTTDEADREPPRRRSCGRSQAPFYNTARPHSSLGDRTPAEVAEAFRRETPPKTSEARLLQF
jgi:hypothetical protein